MCINLYIYIYIYTHVSSHASQLSNGELNHPNFHWSSNKVGDFPAMKLLEDISFAVHTVPGHCTPLINRTHHVSLQHLTYPVCRTHTNLHPKKDRKVRNLYLGKKNKKTSSTTILKAPFSTIFLGGTSFGEFGIGQRHLILWGSAVGDSCRPQG